MPFDFSGVWQNQRESRLILEQHGGDVVGWFESGVGDQDQILWVRVRGRVLEDLLTFNARYSGYKTLISWVGQHTVDRGTGEEQIITHWLHATNVENDELERFNLWASNRIGSDVFVPFDDQNFKPEGQFIGD